MALINSQNVKRLDIPHEPGSWVEVRPLTAGDMEGLTADGSQVKVSIEALASIIQAWSYDEAPSLDTVRRLDLDTFVWLGQETMRLSGVRDDVEKKESGDSSPPTLPPQPQAESPVNWGT